MSSKIREPWQAHHLNWSKLRANRCMDTNKASNSAGNNYYISHRIIKTNNQTMDPISRQS